LLEQCAEKTPIGDLGCAAYVKGIADGLRLGAILGAEGHKFCWPPNGLEPKQARLIIEKYLREHPADLHYSVGEHAALALYQAFVCKNSN